MFLVLFEKFTKKYTFNEPLNQFMNKLSLLSQSKSHKLMMSYRLNQFDESFTE